MRERRLMPWGLVVALLLMSACRGQESEKAEKQKAEPTQAPATAAPTAEPTATATEAPLPTPTVAPAEESKEPGDLRLLGIVRAGTPSAVIGHDGKQEIFRKGDSVYDYGTVKEVRDDSVVLHSGSKDITLKLVTEAPAPLPSPAEPLVESAPVAASAPPPVAEPLSRSETRAALKDLSPMLHKAEAKRVAVGGGHGLELAKVDPASFLAKLGLRSGDVLQKIEGTALEDLDHVPDLSSAADRAELTIGFSRNDIGLTVSRPIQ